MEEKFERIREMTNRKLDELMHKLDTVYTPVKREKKQLRSVDAVIEPESQEAMDLKTRHKLQEEALKKQQEESKN